MKNIIKLLNRNVWNLAFIDFNEKIINKDAKVEFRKMKHNYTDRWFADPFILDVTDQYITVLVEELKYKRNIGRIARLSIRKEDYKLEEMRIILELPSHLSFPFIFRYEDRIYILPENSQSGVSTIYQYNGDILTPLNNVCNEPLVDATINKIEDKYYLFSTQQPNANGKNLDIREFDPENLTASEIIQTFCFDTNIARNAGATFKVNDGYYRPAQDCEVSYGRGTIVQKMLIDSNGKFRFENLKSYYPIDYRYYLGLHTLNSYKCIAVIDMLGKRNPLFSRLLSLVR